MLHKYATQLLIVVLLLHVASFGCVSASDVTDLTRKAELGNANAQFQLSQAYEKGNGVKQDYQLAFEWCAKLLSKAMQKRKMPLVLCTVWAVE